MELKEALKLINKAYVNAENARERDSRIMKVLTKLQVEAFQRGFAKSEKLFMLGGQN